MAESASSFQVVFMVDVDSYCKTEDSEASTQKIVNEIGLCAIKILVNFHHLSTRRSFVSSSSSSSIGPNSDSIGSHSFLWGYKFYNSLSQQIDRSSFKECSLKNFESFHEEVEQRLEYEKLRLDVSHLKTNSLSGAQSLARGLTELVHDFQWDRPDISSPVRPRSRDGRRSTGKDPNGPHHKNIVFIFSACPHSLEDMKLFIHGHDSSKRTPRKGKDIIKSLLSPSLQQQLCETAKISVHWIDTHWQSQCVYEVTRLNHVFILTTIFTAIIFFG